MKKVFFLCLCVMLLGACRKSTTLNALDSGVPMTDWGKEEKEDYFDPNYRPKDTEGDNLRGLDPIYEDDTEDMGMTRYQENNDEEGWD